MSTIPFIEALFFDPKEGRIELETRFETHLHRLRGQGLGLPPDNAEDENDTAPDRHWRIRLSDDDEARIKRRVKRILGRRKAASALEHLKRDDRERLEVLTDGARLIRIRKSITPTNWPPSFTAVCPGWLSGGASPRTRC